MQRERRAEGGDGECYSYCAGRCMPLERHPGRYVRTRRAQLPWYRIRTGEYEVIPKVVLVAQSTHSTRYSTRRSFAYLASLLLQGRGHRQMSWIPLIARCRPQCVLFPRYGAQLQGPDGRMKWGPTPTPMTDGASLGWALLPYWRAGKAL